MAKSWVRCQPALSRRAPACPRQQPRCCRRSHGSEPTSSSCALIISSPTDSLACLQAPWQRSRESTNGEFFLRIWKNVQNHTQVRSLLSCVTNHSFNQSVTWNWHCLCTGIGHLGPSIYYAVQFGVLRDDPQTWYLSKITQPQFLGKQNYIKKSINHNNNKPA